MQISYKLKLKIFLAVLVFLGGCFAVFADENDFNPQSYLFYLYYDSGKLFADRDYQIPYDITTVNFVASADAEMLYGGSLIGFKGQVLSDFNFDPTSGNSAFKKGKISVWAPYFYNAEHVDFYNNLDEKLLTISVSAHSFCNDDDKCNSNTGENSSICPDDCKLKPPPSSGAPSSPPSSMFNNKSILVITFFIIAVAILAAWSIIKRRRANSPMPPATPPNV